MSMMMRMTAVTLGLVCGLVGSVQAGSFNDSNLPRGWTTKNDAIIKRILLRANTGTMIRFF